MAPQSVATSYNKRTLSLLASLAEGDGFLQMLDVDFDDQYNGQPFFERAVADGLISCVDGTFGGTACTIYLKSPGWRVLGIERESVSEMLGRIAMAKMASIMLAYQRLRALL